MQLKAITSKIKQRIWLTCIEIKGNWTNGKSHLRSRLFLGNRSLFC